jgi:hypothetical protein
MAEIRKQWSVKHYTKTGREAVVPGGEAVPAPLVATVVTLAHL